MVIIHTNKGKITTFRNDEDTILKYSEHMILRMINMLEQLLCRKITNSPIIILMP
jgi:hypothetical protein